MIEMFFKCEKRSSGEIFYIVRFDIDGLGIVKSEEDLHTAHTT